MAKRGRRLDGSVPGIEFKRYRGGSNPSPLDCHPQNDLPHPQHPYSPHPGAMDWPEVDYDVYTADGPHAHTHALRLDPVAQEPAPRPSFYDRGAAIFEILDQQEQEMREHSYPDRLSISEDPAAPANPEEPISPLHQLTAPDEISLETEIQVASQAQSQMDGSLQHIVDTHFQPAEETSSEQMQQEMYPPP